MLQPRKGPIFLSIGVSWRMFIRHSPVTTDKRPSLRCNYALLNTVSLHI